MRAASMRFFDGRHPRFTQVPPRVRDSVITALLPSSAALSAAANAVEPEPRMTRSKRSSLMLSPSSPPQCGSSYGEDARRYEQQAGIDQKQERPARGAKRGNNREQAAASERDD